MGVKGLNSYLNTQHNYVENVIIRDTPVLIDGNNLMYHLYFHPTTKDLHLYGGDYANYAKNLRNFFLKLKLCDITPLVIFDGVYEASKLGTVIKRFRDSIRDCSKTYAPVLMKIQLLQFLKHQKIFHLQTDFEADRTITELAVKYQIPVLSNDTDFLINTNMVRVNLDDMKFKSIKKQWMLSSRTVNFKRLMTQFNITDVRVISLCSFVIGNDVSDCRNIFFNEKTACRIETIFRFFGGLSYKLGCRFLISKLGHGAVEKIRDCVKGYVGFGGEEEVVEIAGKFLQSYSIFPQEITVDLEDEMWAQLPVENLSVNQYEENAENADSQSEEDLNISSEREGNFVENETYSEGQPRDEVKSNVDGIKENSKTNEIQTVECSQEKLKHPSDTLKHRYCTHPTYLRKIQENKMVFLQPQLELSNTVSHHKSLDIIKLSCNVLTSSVTVFTRIGKKLDKIVLETNSLLIDNGLVGKNTVDVHKLYQIDENVVSQFPPTFRILIMTLKYYGDFNFSVGVLLSYMRNNLKSVSDVGCNTISECINGQGKSKMITALYRKVDRVNYKYDINSAFKLSEYSCVLFHTIMLFKLLNIYKCPVIEYLDLRFIYNFNKYFNGDLQIFQEEPIFTTLLAMKELIKN